MYTLDKKYACVLSLQKQDLPMDIIHVIWKKILELEEEEKNSVPPSIKNKHAISKKTRDMMTRWRRNGQWIKHCRNIQFE